jgi:hypothetical protein
MTEPMSAFADSAASLMIEAASAGDCASPRRSLDA